MTATATSPLSRLLATRSASEDMPYSSASQPIAMPQAAAMPTRMPVKLPGPTPTITNSGLRPASNSPIIGTSSSEWPRPIRSSLRATHSPAASNNAAVQAALEVSKAKIIANSGHKPRKAASPARLDGFYRLDLGDVVANEAFDAALQRHGRGGASGAG